MTAAASLLLCVSLVLPGLATSLPALCAALLGVPLVLKRYSMIGDGLSHVSFGALSIALACGWAPLRRRLTNPRREPRP